MEYGNDDVYSLTDSALEKLASGAYIAYASTGSSVFDTFVYSWNDAEVTVEAYQQHLNEILPPSQRTDMRSGQLDTYDQILDALSQHVAPHAADT